MGGPRHPVKPDTSAGFRPALAPGLDFLSAARDSLRLDGILDGSLLSPRIHRFLLDWAGLRNAYSSARLEGNPLTPDEAKAVLTKGRGSSPAEEEVLRLARAYARIHETADPRPVTISTITALHEDLFAGVLPGEVRPGRLKDRRNGVFDSATGLLVFEATPPERTETELQALLDWFYGPGQLLEPAVACGLFFAEFQSIHPFLDGNGRVGRLLNMMLLRASGFRNATLTAFDGIIYRRREQYYHALRATNAGRNLHVWLRFYTDALRRAYREAIDRGDLRPVLASVTAPSEREILEWLLGTGVDWFRRGDLPNPTGYANITLTTALSRLSEAGFLEREGTRRAARYRLSDKFLQRIHRRGWDGSDL